MTKHAFFLKLGMLFLLISGLLAMVFCARYSGRNTRYLLLNHLSNSISYNSNFQNLLDNTQPKDIDFLIIGSSMSLNNISGELIADSFKCNAYNLSSWGFRSDKVIGLFKSVPLKNCRRALLAFNNIDFGINVGANYDFQATNFYANGNSFDRFISFLKTFNFMEFDEAFQTRKTSSDRNSKYLALGFDKHGSVLLDTANFTIDTFRYGSYTDTSGFSIFLKNVQLLKAGLGEKGIRFSLVYLPYRRDLLTAEREAHNAYVADRLRLALPDNFIDMHSLEVPRDFYADAAHTFRTGAEFLTKKIIDSVKR